MGKVAVVGQNWLIIRIMTLMWQNSYAALSAVIVIFINYEFMIDLNSFVGRDKMASSSCEKLSNKLK